MDYGYILVELSNKSKKVYKAPTYELKVGDRVRIPLNHSEGVGTVVSVVNFANEDTQKLVELLNDGNVPKVISKITEKVFEYDCNE